MKLLLSLLLLFFFSTSAFASARLILPVGEKLQLKAKTSFKSPEYSWVLISKDGYILNNQTSSKYSQKFKKEGKYDLNLTVKDTRTLEIKQTTVEVIVGTPNKYFVNFDPKIETEPITDYDDEVSFQNNGGKVTLFLGNSVGIKSFSIDEDLSVDSDEDGIKDNDKDNEKCVQITKCPTYSFDAKKEKDNFKKAKIIFIGHNNQKEEKIINISFNKKVANENSELKAIIKSLPKYNKEEKEIYVPFGINGVLIYGKYSQGDFLRYRIDENIGIDSDGDGKPGNDVDNKKHKSFKDGSAYEIKKGDLDEQVVQLLVVSGKKGSLIRRKIIWGKENTNALMALSSSTTQAFVNKRVYFGVSGEGLSKYDIEWDFDGDGAIDIVGNQNAFYEYSKPGKYDLLVNIKDKETGEIIKKQTLEITVKEPIQTEFDTKKPITDFSYKINGPMVEFTQKVNIDKDILDQKYNSYWKFGNGNISLEKNPQFIYSKIGEYEVEFLTTDSVGKTSLITKKIKIKQLSLSDKSDEIDDTNPKNNSGNGENENNSSNDSITVNKNGTGDLANNTDETSEKNGEQSGENSLNKGDGGFFSSGIFSNILWILAIIIGLIFLFIFIYLIFQKIKNPNYTFGELLEEERERFLSVIEGEPYIPNEEKEEFEEEDFGEMLAETVDKIEEKNPEIIEKKIENKVEIKPEEKKIFSKNEEIKPEIKEEKKENIPNWLSGNSEEKNEKLEKKVENKKINIFSTKEEKKPEISEKKNEEIFNNKKEIKTEKEAEIPAWLSGESEEKKEIKTEKNIKNKKENIFTKKENISKAEKTNIFVKKDNKNSLNGKNNSQAKKANNPQNNKNNFGENKKIENKNNTKNIFSNNSSEKNNTNSGKKSNIFNQKNNSQNGFKKSKNTENNNLNFTKKENNLNKKDNKFPFPPPPPPKKIEKKIEKNNQNNGDKNIFSKKELKIEEKTEEKKVEINEEKENIPTWLSGDSEEKPEKKENKKINIFSKNEEKQPEIVEKKIEEKKVEPVKKEEKKEIEIPDWLK